MNRSGRFLVSIAAIAGLVATGAIHSPVPSIGQGRIANNVLARELAIELGQQQRPSWLRPVSSGPMYTVLQAAGVIASRAASGGSQRPFDSSTGSQGCQRVIIGHATNVRVN